MVAVVSGNGLGLGTSSLNSLGSEGALGNASEGKAGEQVYINSTTGNLVIQDSEDYLAALGLDLPITRTYNSQGTLTDDFGGEWRLGINERLINLTGTVNTAGSTIVKVFGDESQVTFTYDATKGEYIASGTAGAHDELTFNATTQQWTWVNGYTRQSETYDSSGRLLSARDIDGNTRSYVYTGALLSQITDASGQTTTFSYSGNNLTQVSVTSQGQAQVLTRYTYDPQNRLATVSVDLSPQDNSIADGKVFTTTYGYDGTSNRMASITRSDGTSVNFTYVQVGSAFRVETYVTSLGTTRLSYSTATGGGVQTQITDVLGNVTTLVHDTQGRLTDTKIQSGSGLVETQYQYDTNGNVTQVTKDPSGQPDVTVFQYDTQGNLLLQRDADGNTITRTYSPTNQLLTSTSYLIPDPDADGAGLPDSPVTTRYAYDSEGHLRFVVSPEGRVTEYRYDAAGERTTTLEYPGGEIDVSTLSATTALTEAQLVSWAATQDLTKLERTDYTYDFRGQISNTTAYAATDNSGAGVATSASSTQFVYDQRGRLLQTIDARGIASATNPANPNLAYSTTYLYDGLGRVTSKTVWNSSGNTTTTTTQYDDAGGHTIVTFASGLVSTSTYNHANELISSTNVGPGSQALGTTTYAYDGDGRLRMVTDADANKSYILYDAAGRKVADIDADGEMTEYVYDNSSNLVETIAYSQRLSATTIATLVDQSGNPANVSLAALKTSIGRGTAPDLSTDRVSINVYDVAGRLSATVDGTGSITGYVYDGLNHVTQMIQYATRVSVPSVTDPTVLRTLTPVSNRKDRVTQYIYDADGNRVGMVDADAYLTEYVYDAARQLIRQTAYAFQANEGTTLDEVRPDPESNDITTRYFYDGEGRQIGALDGVGYLTETLYDAAGNVSQQIRYDSVLNFFDGATVDSLRPTGVATHTTSFVYDGANRLVQQTNFEGTVQANVYDAVGNLVSSTSAQGTTEARTSQSRYDALGRVIAQLTPQGSSLITDGMAQADIDAIWNQYSVRYSYDSMGRVISSVDQDNNKTLFYYDSEGRLVFKVNAAGGVAEHHYDAFGEVTDDISYAKPIVTTGLAGGAVTSQLTSLVTGAANAAFDSHTTTSYTVLGQVGSIATAEGSLTTDSYDVFGDMVRRNVAVQGGTSEFDYQYDAMDRLIQVDADKLGIDAIQEYQYDAFGRVNITFYFNTNSNSTSTAADYDQLGRVIHSYDGFFNIEQTTYDAFSRVQTVQDRLGNTTTYTYDDSARSVTVTTPEGVSTQTIHNRDGQIHSVTKAGLTTSYSYDVNGRKSGVSDNLGLIESCTYDPAGLQQSEVDGNGTVTAYTYDAANRVKTKTADSGTGTLNLVTTYTYDGEGRTTQVDEPGGKSTKTTYDRDGRVTKVEVDPTHLDLTTTYTYDVAGNVACEQHNTASYVLRI
jgi:YD repeat-containing protein